MELSSWLIFGTMLVRHFSMAVVAQKYNVARIVCTTVGELDFVMGFYVPLCAAPFAFIASFSNYQLANVIEPVSYFVLTF